MLTELKVAAVKQAMAELTTAQHTLDTHAAVATAEENARYEKQRQIDPLAVERNAALKTLQDDINALSTDTGPDATEAQLAFVLTLQEQLDTLAVDAARHDLARYLEQLTVNSDRLQRNAALSKLSDAVSAMLTPQV